MTLASDDASELRPLAFSNGLETGNTVTIEVESFQCGKVDLLQAINSLYLISTSFNVFPTKGEKLKELKLEWHQNFNYFWIGIPSKQYAFSILVPL